MFISKMWFGFSLPVWFTSALPIPEHIHYLCSWSNVFKYLGLTTNSFCKIVSKVSVKISINIYIEKRYEGKWNYKHFKHNGNIYILLYCSYCTFFMLTSSQYKSCNKDHVIIDTLKYDKRQHLEFSHSPGSYLVASEYHNFTQYN